MFVPEYNKPDAPGVHMGFDNTVNIYHVVEPEEGLSDLTVVLTAPPNDQNIASIRQPVPLTGSGFAVRDESIGLPIGVPGDWTIEVAATTPAGAVTSTAQVYSVRDQDGGAASTTVEVPSSAPTTEAG